MDGVKIQFEALCESDRANAEIKKIESIHGKLISGKAKGTVWLLWMRDFSQRDEQEERKIMSREKILRSQNYILENSMLGELTQLLEHYKQGANDSIDAFPEELEHVLKDAVQCMDIPYTGKQKEEMQWMWLRLAIQQD